MNRHKHYPYRAAVVRWVDSLLYEAGNSRRSHNRVYVQIIHRLCGIGEETFRNYLHFPASELAAYELPPDLKSLLMLYVVTYKSLPAKESERYLQLLAQRSVNAVDIVRKNNARLTADKMIEHLQAMEKSCQ